MHKLSNIFTSHKLLVCSSKGLGLHTFWTRKIYPFSASRRPDTNTEVNGLPIVWTKYPSKEVIWGLPWALFASWLVAIIQIRVYFRAGSAAPRIKLWRLEVVRGASVLWICYLQGKTCCHSKAADFLWCCCASLQLVHSWIHHHSLSFCDNNHRIQVLDKDNENCVRTRIASL